MNQQERQIAKNLLQYLTDHDLTSGDEFRAAIIGLNITTTGQHDRGEFYGTTFGHRYLVDVFSPETVADNLHGVRFEFDTKEQADAFAAEQRMAGDVPAAEPGTPAERRQQLEGYIIAYLAGEGRRVYSRHDISLFVKDSAGTFSLPADEFPAAIESIMQWQGQCIAARAGK